MSINYLEELNESQREAVIYNEGPSLVIAGAGSGKTRVLTYKIAYLLENGYEPWNILVLTFTNKAAREMKERISKKVGEQKARYLWMGTFHSVFSRILRFEADKLGFTSQYTIYDTADSKSLIQSIIKEMGLNEKVYRPNVVQARISNAKNHLIMPASYAVDKEMLECDSAAKMPAIHEIYNNYWNRCKRADAMDFDDLLLYTFILFDSFPDILEKYHTKFRYLLVDEYQDTNYAQHAIVMQLSRKNQMICVVGDDAQSIYSFRGARIDNILNFPNIYPKTKVFKLEQNYRSTQSIISAASNLIEKNERQIPKKVYSMKERGEAIEVLQAYSDIDEAEIVANKIIEMRRKRGYEYADFAILYRMNTQSRVFEETLRKRNIPYVIYGGFSFYQRKEIKDTIAYFRLAVNPSDEEAFKRIINYPARGIGEITLGKIVDAAIENQISLWTAINEPVINNLKINKSTLTKLEEFRELIENFIHMQLKENAYETAREIIRQSGIINDISQDDSPENLSRKENIEELVSGIYDFCSQRLEEGNTNTSLADFLSEVSLLTDQDSNKEEDEKKVTLMTVHSAKGLEFPNIFVVGLEENLFPGAMSNYSPYAVEEERRLFYVAITRAEEHCFLSFAKKRFKYGKTEFSSPSRFLKDIDTCYLNISQMTSEDEKAEDSRYPYQGNINYFNHSADKKSPATNSRTLKRIGALPPASSSEASASLTNVQVGQVIEHERFGIGEVIKIEGTGDNAKATINFRNAGSKQLLLRFARFKIIT